MASEQQSPIEGAPSRVLIVDDSAVIRGLVSRWLGEAGGFEVVGSAANGRIAVDLIQRSKPDLILLDIEMPEMDGITALPLLLKAAPNAKVVVISTLTKRNAEISLRCLSLGATDYLPKPEGSRSPGSLNEFREELIKKLRGLGRQRNSIVKSAGHPQIPPAIKPSFMGGGRPRCLLIGASTGGPRAIERVLLDLGETLTALPILIVQHMPTTFTAVFAEHLQNLLSVPAREGKEGEVIRPGNIYVAPGGRHMGLTIIGGKPAIRLDDGPPENFCRPAVDFLFRDAASQFGSSALTLILTGMGSDGTIGARLLTEAGATVLVQDEASSIVWGMPGSVAKAGLARDIIPLDAIGRTITNMIKRGEA